MARRKYRSSGGDTANGAELSESAPDTSSVASNDEPEATAVDASADAGEHVSPKVESSLPWEEPKPAEPVAAAEPTDSFEGQDGLTLDQVLAAESVLVRHADANAVGAVAFGRVLKRGEPTRIAVADIAATRPKHRAAVISEALEDPGILVRVEG